MLVKRYVTIYESNRLYIVHKRPNIYLYKQTINVSEGKCVFSYLLKQ